MQLKDGGVRRALGVWECMSERRCARGRKRTRVVYGPEGAQGRVVPSNREALGDDELIVNEPRAGRELGANREVIREGRSSSREALARLLKDGGVR